jgi:DeoR family transcriptional regulator, aga operon transcriptional repressor
LCPISIIGPTAIESLNAVVMDKVFIGVCGVDPEHSATIIEAEEAAVFRAMSRRAKPVSSSQIPAKWT